MVCWDNVQQGKLQTAGCVSLEAIVEVSRGRKDSDARAGVAENLSPDMARWWVVPTGER
jgi:hypothetical protein